MSAPSGDFGGGGAPEGGTFEGASGESAGFQSGGTSDGQSSGSSGNAGSNGAWNELLSIVPREFHPVVTPHLQKFDSNYGQLAQQYAPWKKTFVDKGTTPDELTAAHQLYTLVNQNPQLVYERLAAALGYSAQQQQAANQYFQPGQSNEQYDPNQGMQPPQEYQQEQFEDPRLMQMSQQMAQMQQMLEQQYNQAQAQQEAQQRQEMTADYERQLDTGIKTLLKKDPNFDVGDVLNRVWMQVSQDQEIDIQRAYNDHIAYVQRIRATPMNGAGAPRVMPTGGGMPPTIDTSRPKTTAEKTARAMQIIQAAQQQGY